MPRKTAIHVRVPQGIADLSEPIFYDLPFPPSVNAYYRMFRGIMTIGPRGREYKLSVINDTPDVPCIREPVIVIVTLHPPTLAKRDLDNFSKALFDAMADTGIIENDLLIRESHVRWGQKVPGGLAAVCFRRWDGGFWDRLFDPAPAI